MQVTIKPKTVKIDYCGQDYLGADGGWRLSWAYYACNDALRTELKTLFAVAKDDRDDAWHSQRSEFIARVEHCPITKSHRVYA